MFKILKYFKSTQPKLIPRSTKKNIKRKAIPKAIREQVWIKYMGKNFENTCYVPWCKNKIDVFNFHVGHDVPVKDGGENEIGNLKPICARCNLSMGAKYTIKEWEKISGTKTFCNIL